MYKRQTSDRIGIYDRAWDEGMRLRYSNELVNTKIYRLIMDFEAEDTAFLLGKIDQTEAIRRRSSYVLGGIAIVAVVLMLLFVLQLSAAAMYLMLIAQLIAVSGFTMMLR